VIRPLIALTLLMFCTCPMVFAQVDESPLNLEPVVAFENLKWTGWEPDKDGLPFPLRPILLTHAGDGSGRMFVPQQQGIVHVFSADSKETKIFLDLSKQVRYIDKENEEGFLGMAFHPKYKSNGEFFVFYTTTSQPHTTVISRFKVSKDDPNKADLGSEEELIRVAHPYWNHKGGTICFGPDGFLYIALGDGGAGNDPHGNGQNLQTMLGKILRIDVDKKDAGLKYAIPKDNPFLDQLAGKKPIALPEIYCYGLRNVWRMSFDKETGQFWVADVGQNLWEEINIGVKGGNYGWNLREAKHEFAPNSTNQAKGLIDPIWEYHHDIGKSITGGVVYRGKKLPELVGHYLYADYVSGKIWALKYDDAKKEVVANRTIPYSGANLPVISFGEDESNEVYFMIVSPTGKGIYTFQKKAK
jgi:quinoprotein glucose dehydrogenase